MYSAADVQGRLTQRESATFTRWKSLVQIQYRLPSPSGACKPYGLQAFFIYAMAGGSGTMQTVILHENRQPFRQQL